MTDRIRQNASELVKSIVPIENEDECDDELDMQAARAVTEAFLKWDAEHPGEDGTVHVERDDEGRLTVTVMPKK